MKKLGFDIWQPKRATFDFYMYTFRREAKNCLPKRSLLNQLICFVRDRHLFGRLINQCSILYVTSRYTVCLRFYNLSFAWLHVRLVRNAWATSRCSLNANVSCSLPARPTFSDQRFWMTGETYWIRRRRSLFFPVTRETRLFPAVSPDTLRPCTVRSFSQLASIVASSHGGLQDESMV